MSPFDTIVAPITSQPAAVGVVRVSGQEAWEVASRVFLGWPRPPEPFRAVYGRYTTGDDGLALPFAAGHSYTGEQAVELSCHGALPSVRALVGACIEAGARHAEPGEFTQRAFLNGRMDLTQAEAVADTVSAMTDAQLVVANRQREGVLYREVSALRGRILRLLGAVEASVDFEEEIGPLDRTHADAEIVAVAERVERLAKTTVVGRIIRRGLRVAIVGPPNAGKSSLFNALVGRDRAIVTPIAGTTRDYVEETVDMGGVAVVLIDTAGLRETDDLVESLGVQRSLAQAAHADLTWFVYDGSQPRPASEQPWSQWIANKADLIGGPGDLPEGHLLVSATTGEGLEGLVARVACYAEEAVALSIPPVSERHGAHLQEALQWLNQARDTLVSNRPDDLLSTLLKGAANHLGEITGETASEDMIQRIFADFCIGK